MSFVKSESSLVITTDNYILRFPFLTRVDAQLRVGRPARLNLLLIGPGVRISDANGPSGRILIRFPIHERLQRDPLVFDCVSPRGREYVLHFKTLSRVYIVLLDDIFKS
jgi:hypothetical protein